MLHMREGELEAVVHHRTRMQEAVPVLVAVGVLAVLAACVYFGASGFAGSFAHAFANKLLPKALVFAALSPIVLFVALSQLPSAAAGRVTDDGVFVGRRRIVDFGRYEAAYYEPRGDSSGLVCFVGRGGRRLGAVVSEIDRAARILGMAGAANRPSSVAPTTNKRVTVMMAMVPLVASLMGQDIAGAATFGVVGALAALTLFIMRHRRVTVCDDNIVVERALGKSVVPLCSVVRAVPLEAYGLRIEHEQGTLDVDGGSEMELADGRLVLRRDALIERIGAAREDLQARERAVALARPLVRGSRDVEGWLRDLVAVSSGGAYRGRAFREDDLWAILEEPSIPEDARAAAALLLRQSVATAESSVPARMRVVATETESPRLRVAIEEIVEGDEGEERREAFAALAASR